MKFLRIRVNELAEQIEKSGKSKDYIDIYLASIKRGQSKAQIVDEVEWDLLLPEEKSRKVFAHYHTMRTELLELMRQADDASRKSNMAQWLESPWVKGGVTLVSLAKGAEILYEVLRHSGLFITHVRDQGAETIK
jgi:selenophosphate synthetase-related protein